MREYISINLDGKIPLVAAAIHNGHRLSETVSGLCALPASDRLREEDPFTGIWTDITDNQIIAHHSRFEFDLNRPPEKAIYLVPSDAWGLQVWKKRLPDSCILQSQRTYFDIYREIHSGLNMMLRQFGAIVIFDLHSYNHRPNGPKAPPEDAELNPEINIGTGTMDRDFWGHLVDRFIKDLCDYSFPGRHLDVRENIKFMGGYFPKWIHERFPESICCISIEVKKFFMDEWTGTPDHSIIMNIGNALRSTVPGVLEELSKRNSNVSAVQL